MTNKKYVVTAIVLFVLVLLFHFFTLTISPLVWGDEIIYNAITLDFLKHKTFYDTIDPTLLKGKEALYFGPVYFGMNAEVIKFFGTGPFQQRIIGLLLGALFIFFLSLFSYKEISNKKLWLLLVIALLFDPFFNASLNRGRFDNVAGLFYFFSAWLILFKSRSNKYQWLIYVSSGFLYGLSILTTSRLLLFGIPFMLIAGIEFLKAENKLQVFKYWLCWGLTVIPVFTSWIFIKFGSIGSFFSYYAAIKKEHPDFLGSNLTIPIEVVPLLTLTVMLFAVTVIKKKSVLNNYTILFAVFFIAVFYLLVGDVGPYSVMVIPYLYLLIGKSGDALENENSVLKNIPKYLLSALILFNVGMFVFKGTVLALDAEARNYQLVYDFAKQNIPAGSRVVGDEVYYYSIINNQSEFQLYNSSDYDTKGVEADRRLNFDYDYLFVSERINKRAPKFLELYASNSQLIKVAELKSNHFQLSKWLASIKLLKRFGTFGNYDFSSEGYDGVLYKRIKSK